MHISRDCLKHNEGIDPTQRSFIRHSSVYVGNVNDNELIVGRRCIKPTLIRLMYAAGDPFALTHHETPCQFDSVNLYTHMADR